MPLTDALGTQHVCAPGARIVSLVPSITELLCDLGLAAQLAGRTGFCIHPAEVVKSIPKVGGTKDVNIDENEKPTVEALAAFVPNIVVTHPMGPRDNLALARLMGGIFGVAERAEQWCADFEHAYALLKATPKGPAANVLYCIWQDPWMSISGDTYIARMLAEIGWHTPPLGAARYPAFSWSDDLVARIDGVLLSSEPYRFTQAHVDALEKQIGKPVHLVDGEMMSWYGSRSVAGLAYLRELALQRWWG